MDTNSVGENNLKCKQMFTTSCYDIWRKEEGTLKIITLCKDLDVQLGGGIPMSLVTELCGAPGCGKTQMCLQLSINVQFPRELGGLGGKALYVDTNQGFHPQRLKEIALCMEQRFEKTFARMYNNTTPRPTFNGSTLLNNVGYIYCANYKQLMVFIINLRELLNKDNLLKLVIIDSFAFPLRNVDNDERVSIIYKMLTQLQILAMEFEIAIVITNELTTRTFGENDWKICPALGDSYAHKINQRIILSKEQNSNHYVAFIDKSVTSPRIGIPFQIHKSGIRGAP